MSMKLYKRWTAAALVCVMSATVSITSGLALPATESFAEFRIDAAGNDIQDRTITVDLYRLDKKGRFQVDDTIEYTCKLNRATRDASFFIQPQEDGVWVSVDYLTDLNGDGTYELLDGGDSPVWDVMDLQGGLTQSKGEAAALTSDETYILSPETLVLRSKEAVQNRTPEGAFSLDVGSGTVAKQDFPLCMIKLHRTDPGDGQDYVQTYYLEIYDRVLIPTDVSPSQWYYEPVKFVLNKGYFTGTKNGLFEPEGQLTRAQLAQVLWTMSGCQNAKMSQFSDVAVGSWYYSAVSWCQQEGLIAGYSSNIFAPNDTLSREQMVSILYRYAKYAGGSLRVSDDLSQFDDVEDVSRWAVESMRWAVTNGVLSNTESSLLPSKNVTRAEMAAALYAFEVSSNRK